MTRVKPPGIQDQKRYSGWQEKDAVYLVAAKPMAHDRSQVGATGPVVEWVPLRQTFQDDHP
ncbi:hypothetical protein GGE65_004316 [Skermanella aerolata]|uniref:hypothetical protein n=1 Tax=Skermanella aerolata TaxID=393310 RepID=UPI003D197E3C